MKNLLIRALEKAKNNWRKGSARVAQKQKNLSYYKSWCMENPFSLFISIFSYAKEAYRTLAEQIVLNFRSLKL